MEEKYIYFTIKETIELLKVIEKLPEVTGITLSLKFLRSKKKNE